MIRNNNYLTESQIDGHRLRYIEEPSVVTQRERESVQRLENVGSLVQIEHVVCNCNGRMQLEWHSRPGLTRLGSIEISHSRPTANAINGRID